MHARKLLSAMAGFALLIAILLSVIDGLSFRRSFYEYEYEKNSTAEYIGMSEESLMDATDALLDYLHGLRDDIKVTAAVNGYVREVYDTRETLHMVDVRNLYRNAILARNLMLTGGLLVFIVLIWRHINEAAELLFSGFTNGLIITAVCVACLLGYALVDFNSFWMNFHYVFFDNDLFLLDPNVSIMINMFPETFFFDLVIRIIAVFSFLLALIFGILLFLRKREKSAAYRSV
ncbi:MAG: TIGR01906 family membrane protein [Solobacterium sp.]|nr:TIGR01906 family membrane protein [Solobacterium sp.]